MHAPSRQLTTSSRSHDSLSGPIYHSVWPTQPLAFRPSIPQASPDPFLDQRPLELRHGADDLELRVRRTSSSRLRVVNFSMSGRDYEAIEQNPEKPSRWAQLARDGHQVVQFKDAETNSGGSFGRGCM